MSAVRVPDFGGIYALPEPEALRVAAPLVLLDEAMSTYGNVPDDRAASPAAKRVARRNVPYATCACRAL